MSNAAIWGIDYDGHEDKCYDRPVCPKCKEPFGKYDDGKYYCYACGNEVTVTDPKMIDWLKVHEESKTEMRDCFSEPLGCGGRAFVETTFVRSPITGKWRTACGKCTKCGMSFIV